MSDQCTKKWLAGMTFSCEWEMPDVDDIGLAELKCWANLSNQYVGLLDKCDCLLLDKLKTIFFLFLLIVNGYDKNGNYYFPTAYKLNEISIGEYLIMRNR